MVLKAHFVTRSQTYLILPIALPLIKLIYLQLFCFVVKSASLTLNVFPVAGSERLLQTSPDCLILFPFIKLGGKLQAISIASLACWLSTSAKCKNLKSQKLELKLLQGKPLEGSMRSTLRSAKCNGEEQSLPVFTGSVQNYLLQLSS